MLRALSALMLVVVLPARAVRLSVENCTKVFVDPQHGNDGWSGRSEDTPVRTLPRSLAVVRGIKAATTMYSDICVVLRDGRHVVHAPLTLTSAEGGGRRYSVRFVAPLGEHPSVSGGMVLKGWSTLSGGVWEVQVGPASRQLYVNGERSARSRVWFNQKSEVKTWESGLLVRDPTLGSWAGSGIELVWTGGCKAHAPHCAPGEHSYREARCPVQGVRAMDDGWYNVTIPQPCFKNAQWSGCSIPSAVENICSPSSLTLPGTHCRTGSTIRYLPRPGEVVSTTSAILPIVTTLVNGTGTSRISFEGITFEHATWLTPSTPAGYVDDQAGTHIIDGVKVPIPGNLAFVRSREIRFSNCTFRHLGGTAVVLGVGCQSNIVAGCRFWDVSGSAVQFGEFTDYNEKDPTLQTADNTLSDSTVIGIPVEYHGAAAVVAFITRNTSIVHNEIANTTYSGLSVGWGWHTDIGNNSYSAGHTVLGNSIHDVMGLLYDGGAIYTLGYQPRSVITNNHIYRQQHWLSALYHDDGSGGWEDYGNVVHTLGHGKSTPSMAWVSMWTPYCHDIAIHDNYVDNPQVVNHGTRTTITATTVVPDGHWPPKAAAIIKAAGPRSP